MAAMFANASDGYSGTLTSSPEGVNITSQPLPLGDKPPADDMQGSGCPHVARKLPISAVRHGGSDHNPSSSMPLDCDQCGLDVASVLVQQLSVNGPVDPKSASPPLQFRDVMVLTQDTQVSDVSGMVQGLRDAKIPVRVVMNEGEADVIKHSAYVSDEVLILRRGLPGTETGRRVTVLVESEAEENRDSSLRAWAPLPRQAQHVVWVRQPGPNELDEVCLDMEDGVDDVLAQETAFSEAEKNHWVKDRNHIAEAEENLLAKDKNCIVEAEENGRTKDAKEDDLDIAREENHMLRDCGFVDNMDVMTSSPYLTTTISNTSNKHYGGGGGGGGPAFVSSGYGPNNCCDNLCLACCQDVGESSCILCCPCCGELGTWCEACCRGFGDSLNNCLQSMLCCCDSDCCSSGGGGGGCDCDCGDIDCGDCNCGDCNCDCGSCNCDCGNIDCVIM